MEIKNFKVVINNTNKTVEIELEGNKATLPAFKGTDDWQDLEMP